jgi:hypothetical protein
MHDIVPGAEAALSNPIEGLNAIITKMSNHVILKGTINFHFNIEYQQNFSSNTKLFTTLHSLPLQNAVTSSNKAIFISEYGNAQPDRRRKVRRPKLRSLDCIQNDLKSVGIKRWRKKAEDRSVQAIVLKESLVKL